MIDVKDLFEKNCVELPEWFYAEYVEDYWVDAVYSFEEGVHKLSYINEVGDKSIITFDGETYLQGCYVDGVFHCLYKSNGMYAIDY